MDPEKAIDAGVVFCIDNDIMADMLLAHRAEVVDMCLTEYNEKVFVDGIKEEGREEGKNERAKELAVDMLSDNKPIDEILKYSRLEPKDLKEVADSMNITVTIPGL